LANFASDNCTFNLSPALHQDLFKFGMKLFDFFIQCHVSPLRFFVISSNFEKHEALWDEVHRLAISQPLQAYWVKISATCISFKEQLQLLFVRTLVHDFVW